MKKDLHFGRFAFFRALLFIQANLKQMMEAVKKNDANRVTKFTNGGLDPNFSDTDTGG